MGIRTAEEFERVALRLFDYQSRCCAPYREYIELMGIDPTAVRRVADIPFMPIELFKSHDIYSAATPPQVVFTSSATTGMSVSRHMVADLDIYERDFTEADYKP